MALTASTAPVFFVAPSGRGAVLARARAIRAAHRHATLVKILRLAMPVAAVASLGLYFVGPRITVEVGEGTASVETGALTSHGLKMINAKYEGFTNEGGKYEVNARNAIQNLATKDEVALLGITATLEQKAGGGARLAARSGTLYLKQDRLHLSDGIKVVGSDGLEAALPSADLFLKERRILSGDTVAVRTAQGTITATGIEAFAGERRIIFPANVAARLDPPAAKRDGTKPDKARTAFGPTAGGFGGGPIDVTASRLEIRDKAKSALFSGAVTARQTGSTLTADELEISYSGETALGTAAPATGADVESIEARGTVRIVDAAGRSATGAWSAYDRASEHMTLGGGVTLTDGKSILSGDRVEVDLARGISRFPPPGRVRGRFDTGKQTKTAVATDDPIAAGLGGIASSGDGPVDITADQLEVVEPKSVAIFTGDVVAVRGAYEIKARTLEAAYARTGDGSALTRIDAKGRVAVTAPDEQKSTSDWLIYEAKSETITIGGNVVVSQGKNIIKGDKLIIDLKSGKSRFELGEEARADGKGRVKMLINQGQKFLKSLENGAKTATGGGTEGEADLPATVPSQ